MHTDRGHCLQQTRRTAATAATRDSGTKEGRKEERKEVSAQAGGAAGRMEGSGKKISWAAGRKDGGQTGTLGTHCLNMATSNPPNPFFPSKYYNFCAFFPQK